MKFQNNTIFLVGMPGSGKSTLGKILADRLNMSFIDLDEEIEKQVGCSISELFKTHGESHFREVEHQVLKTVANEASSCVIATGGGAPCYFNNMEIIKKSGVSIFLDIPSEELIKRMQESEVAKRPKFSEGKDLEEIINDLLLHRRPFYERADFSWNSKESLDMLISRIR